MDISVARPFDRDRALADIRRINRRTQVANLAAGAAALLFAAGIEALPANPYRFVEGLLVGYGFVCLYAFLRYPRFVLQTLPEICRQDSVVRLTDRAVIEEYPLMRCEMDWRCFTRVTESDAGWLLYFGPRQAISVPRMGVPAGDEADLRQILRQHAAALRG